VGAQDAIGPPRRRRQIGEIDVQRRKLFEFYYADQITPESFHAEDLRLNEQLAALQQEREPEPTDNGIEQFDRVVSPLLNWTGTSSGTPPQTPSAAPCSMNSSSASTCSPTTSKSISEAPEN
jgi:hypothetical protein